MKVNVTLDQCSVVMFNPGSWAVFKENIKEMSSLVFKNDFVIM